MGCNGPAWLPVTVKQTDRICDGPYLGPEYRLKFEFESRSRCKVLRIVDGKNWSLVSVLWAEIEVE